MTYDFICDMIIQNMLLLWQVKLVQDAEYARSSNHSGIKPEPNVKNIIPK